MPTALITGASRGLGFAVAARSLARGWTVVVDGRDADGPGPRRRRWGRGSTPWPATSPTRPTGRELAGGVADLGGLDLLVNNASTLGPEPAAAARPRRSTRSPARTRSTCSRRWR